MKRKLSDYLEMIVGVVMALSGVSYMVYTTINGFFFPHPITGFLVDLVVFGFIWLGFVIFRKGFIIKEDESL